MWFEAGELVLLYSPGSLGPIEFSQRKPHTIPGSYGDRAKHPGFMIPRSAAEPARVRLKSVEGHVVV